MDAEGGDGFDFAGMVVEGDLALFGLVPSEMVFLGFFLEDAVDLVYYSDVVFF